MLDIKNYTMNKPMAPPWLMYPGLPIASMGWRMGYGENYLTYFHKWKENLSEDEQYLYDEIFPMPATWRMSKKIFDEETKAIKELSELLRLPWSDTVNPVYDLDNLKKDYNGKKKIKYIFF